MKILNVVGTRPNFVKIAPLLAEMRARPGVQPLLVHTGQHHDVEMFDCIFRDLGIPRPDFNLEIGRLSHAVQAAEMRRCLEWVMKQEWPDVVVVVGDMNSTLAAALTAVTLGIPVAHVEAGLRSFDRTMPEEVNRVVTDAVADLLLASEPSGMANLVREGRPRERIFLVGNVMIDTLQRLRALARRSSILDDLGLRGGNGSPGPLRYAVMTLHRPALVDRPEAVRKIWEPVQEIAREILIIFPVHLRTRNRLEETGVRSILAGESGRGTRGIRMIPPLGYLQFLRL